MKRNRRYRRETPPPPPQEPNKRMEISAACGESVVRRDGKIITPQMRCFVQKLAEGLTPYQAYTIAYPETAIAERRAIYSRANNLTKNPWVDAQLKNMDWHGMQKARVDREGIISELDAIANSDLRDIMEDTEDGFKVIRKFDEMRPSSRRCIKRLKQKVQYDKLTGAISQVETEVELYDKLTAASTLAKIAGMYNEQQNKYAGVNISFIGLGLPDYDSKDKPIDVTPVENVEEKLKLLDEERDYYECEVGDADDSIGIGDQEAGSAATSDSTPLVRIEVEHETTSLGSNGEELQ